MRFYDFDDIKDTHHAFVLPYEVMRDAAALLKWPAASHDANRDLSRPHLGDLFWLHNNVAYEPLVFRNATATASGNNAVGTLWLPAAWMDPPDEDGPHSPYLPYGEPETAEVSIHNYRLIKEPWLPDTYVPAFGRLCADYEAGGYQGNVALSPQHGWRAGEQHIMCSSLPLTVELDDECRFARYADMDEPEEILPSHVVEFELDECHIP